MKKILASILICILTFALVGCAPKGDSSQVVKDYYQNIKDGNAEGAYDKLAEASKKNFAKEDFIKWQSIGKETSTLKDFKVEKANEYKDKELDGIKFKNVVEFNITEKYQDLYKNKENTINYKRNVVNDNGTWKVYREKENGKDLVAERMIILAWMYIEGKGKTQDLNQAAIILNDSLKYSEKYADTYYALANVYVDLKRYNEAIEAINKCIPKTDKNEFKSNAYNLLGVIYQEQNQIDKAKESFNKALELNSNNQYAKTNLQNLK